MKKKIFITTERELGERCKRFAQDNLPDGWEITNNPDESDVYFSTFSRKILTEDFIGGKEGRRCFNFHLGLFPKYRGAGTYSWVIINGETETGITLHLIDKGIDTGDVISVGKYPIGEHDTANDVLDNGTSKAEEMFKSWFVKLVIGDYKATKQSGEKHPLFTRVMWEEAHDLTRFFRAFCIQGREQAYYINQQGEKVYLQ